jgi:hypothetical protein
MIRVAERNGIFAAALFMITTPSLLFILYNIYVDFAGSIIA